MSLAEKQPVECELALDADEILTALDEGIEGLDQLAAVGHVAKCDACKLIVRLRAKSRHAWTTGMRRESPGTAASTAAVAAPSIIEDNHRLRRIWEGDRYRAPLKTAPRALIAFAAVAPVCLAAIIIAIMHRPSGVPNVVSTSDTATPRVVSTGDHQPPLDNTSSLSPTYAAPNAPQRTAARSVVVPAGSHVTLGFSFPTGTLAGFPNPPAATGTLDGSAELIGPASASATDTTLTLQRGTVKVNGLRHVAVLVPGAKLDPNGATCTVQVDDRGVARVNVESGRALITGKGNSSLVTIEAGGSMDLDPDGALHIAPPSRPENAAPANTNTNTNTISDEETVRRAALSATIAPAPPPPPDTATANILKEALGAAPAKAGNTPPPRLAGNPDEAITAARTKLRNGETAAARSELEHLALSSDARVARRASFTLAEIDLAAGGDRSKARVRLEELVTCPEPALGADAATLLARSLASPTERAAVWKRYLATNPPRPYFERALLDRAEALLDAGSTAEARTILNEAKQSPHLTDSQQRQLERLLFKARELH